MKSIEPFDTRVIDLSDSSAPPAFRDRLLAGGFHRLWAIGDLKTLQNHLIAFFCSSKCTGRVILRVYDLARSLRDAGASVISGFHSSMEKQSLDFLLRGDQPIIICPARGIDGMHLPSAWRKGIGGGRLLLLSPFQPICRRPTEELAEARNRLVAAICDSVLVAHAAEGGKLEELCVSLISAGRTVYTLDLPENIALIEKGALAYSS